MRKGHPRSSRRGPSHSGHEQSTQRGPTRGRVQDADGTPMALRCDLRADPHQGLSRGSSALRACEVSLGCRSNWLKQGHGPVEAVRARGRDAQGQDQGTEARPAAPRDAGPGAEAHADGLLGRARLGHASGPGHVALRRFSRPGQAGRWRPRGARRAWPLCDRPADPADAGSTRPARGSGAPARSIGSAPNTTPTAGSAEASR